MCRVGGAAAGVEVADAVAVVWEQLLIGYVTLKET